MDIVGQEVVLDDTPVLRLVPNHDPIVVIVDEGTAVCRLASCALRLH